ncbi:MAG: hypothetical protein C4329_12320 [Chitinophagaceae bacterium]
MKIVIQNQFEQEHKAWQRSLEFFKQENALLKYRLSEMVDNNEENGFLQMAEYFQNKLLLKDALLNKLLKELHELQSAEKFSEQMISAQNKLRNEVVKAEKKFLDLYSEFNKKMQQKI